jgi:uncharacterized membrane protein
MTVYKLFSNVRASLWLVPVLCVLLGAVVSFATIAVDRANDYDLIPRSLTGDPDAVLGILTTVATSMVSLTALVLTIVLVAVQLAMGQFSPRIVQRLLRDRPSQLAIGLFVATFVQTLLTIREVQIGDPGEPGQVPGVGVLATFALSLASIAVLVMYVHHVGQALRISALVELAGGDTRRLVDKVYPDVDGEPDRIGSRSVTATKSGVLTTVARRQLVATASKAGCALELLPALGDYLPAGGVLFTIIGEPDRLDQDEARNGVVLSMERTLDQDVGYGLRLLVDMAERSLSESKWQDPTTAVQAIDRLHDCLRQLARRRIPDGRHYDDSGQLRLIENVMTWDAYVQLAFDEIRLAGEGSPQVARRLQAALRDLHAYAPPDRRPALQRQLALLSAGTRENFTNDQDAAMAQLPDPGGLGAVGG